MPAHIRTALTATSLSVYFDGGRLLLGIWQAIDFWELRTADSTRMLTLHLLGDGGDGRPWRLGPCFHGASPW